MKTNRMDVNNMKEKKAGTDMYADGKNVKNKGLWRKFFHLVRLAKIPWIGLAIYFLISLSTVYVAVRLPQVESDVFTGNASVENIAFVIGVELATSMVVLVMLASMGVIGGRIDRNFRNAIWQKILRLEPKYFDNVSANSLLSRMTDDAESMKDFITLVLSEITGAATTVATITAMSTMNKGLAVMMAVFIPVFTLFGFFVGRIRMRVGNNEKYKLAGLTDYLSGQLARITVIKAFNCEAYEQERGEQAIMDYYIAQRKVQLAEFFQSTIASIIHIVPDVIMLLVGIYMLETKALTPAGWIVFYAYANQIFGFFSEKISLWINIKTYQGNMNRLSELFSAPEEGVRAYIEEEVSSGDLVFDNVTFSYGDQEILSNASFTFPKNEFTAVFGPSGTGKTTILKLIEQIYEPQEGRILQNGHEIKDYKLENWRRQFSYVKQDTPMISGTIRDNILYGVDGDLTDEQIMSAAKEVRADAFIMECPGGLDYNVGQFGNKLSGGQKQKISVLRAFLQDREYILLDEPTASLDTISVQEVLESIRRLIGKRTVILVAHDDKLIRDASHIIVVEDDAQIYEGSADEVSKVSGFFREILALGGKEGEE